MATKWTTIGSLWAPKPGKEGSHSGNGHSIGVAIIIPANSSLVLVPNKQSGDKSPTWDLCLVKDDTPSPSQRQSQPQNAVPPR